MQSKIIIRIIMAPTRSKRTHRARRIGRTRKRLIGVRRHKKSNKVNRKAKSAKKAITVGTVARFVKDPVVGRHNPVGISSRIVGFDLLPKRWLMAKTIRPRNVFTQHAFSDCDATLEPGGGSGIFYTEGAQFRINGIYSPRFAPGGNQPEGVDFMKSQYSFYRVHGSAIKYTFIVAETGVANYAKFQCVLRGTKYDDFHGMYKPQKFVVGSIPPGTTQERMKTMRASWPEPQSIYRKSGLLYNARNDTKQQRLVLEDKIWIKDLFIKEKSLTGETHVHDIPFNVSSTVATNPSVNDLGMWSAGICIGGCDPQDLYQNVKIQVQMTYYVEWYNNSTLYADVLAFD